MAGEMNDGGGIGIGRGLLSRFRGDRKSPSSILFLEITGSEKVPLEPSEASSLNSLLHRNRGL